MDHVNYDGRTYKYALSIVDVFSRLIFLRPLQSKSGKEIAKHIRDIYREHGKPQVIQSDRGSEFRGKLAELCSEMKIKMVRSRPYHPQAQGNVERSHSTLRRRMLFDLLHNSKKMGMNWVQKLQEYAQVINNEPKEVLRWQTPFKEYYSRNYNSKRSLDLSTQNTVHVENSQTSCPLLYELSSFSNTRKSIRRNAKLGTKQCAERMMRGSAKNVPEYAIGDEVLVRYKLKRGKNIEDAHLRRYHQEEGQEVSYLPNTTGGK